VGDVKKINRKYFRPGATREKLTIKYFRPRATRKKMTESVFARGRR